jgi:phosphatidylglycerophosphate synthase
MNLAMGLCGSVIVAIAGGGRGRFWVWVGVILWQVAYVFDCADGQVARATGKATPSGARLDVLVDVAVQSAMIAAVAEVSIRWSRAPVMLIAGFAATWCVNFVLFLAGKSDGAQGGLVRSRVTGVEMLRVLRDYGLVVLCLGSWVAIAPASVWIVLCCIVGVNTAVLGLYIVTDAVRSLRTVGRRL